MGDIIVVRPGSALWRRLGLRRAARSIPHRSGSRGLHPQAYSVELSRVLSKYPHETERNLQRILDHAEHSAVLIFDEDDALFGHSTPAVDARTCPDGLRGCVHLSRADFLVAIASMRHH
ncbi:AAA family ATPase [Planococcus sp. APC 4015]|nr:AAA family ATPase [Planococcus sp. APC 4015]